MTGEVIDGEVAYTREEIAALYGVSRQTAWQYTGQAGRVRFGFPEPVTGGDGKPRWHKGPVEEFFAKRRPPRKRAVPPPAAGMDPDALIGAPAFAAILNVSSAEFGHLAHNSTVEWARGDDGLLPRPANYAEEVASGRARRRWQWRRGDADAWAHPSRRRRGGRRPGARPRLAHLKALLAEPGAAQMTAPQLAVALTEQLGVEVSAQTVTRLRRQYAEESGAGSQGRP